MRDKNGMYSLLSPEWGMFFLGIFFVVILPLFHPVPAMPGDSGDARFNNYVLEHFHRWIKGLEESFWSARFFYPFPYATAFSGNHLGTAVFYSFFRALGLEREAAFVFWYITGYCLNYSAAVFVLKRYGLERWPSAIGAFFFTFGLPMTAREGHAQLLYRWCAPLATYCLYRFLTKEKLFYLSFLAALVALQLYTEIYTGIFLMMLLSSMLLVGVFAYGDGNGAVRAFFSFLRGLGSIWGNSSRKEQAGFAAAFVGSLFSIAVLMFPYLKVTVLYGFARSWNEIAPMLPRLSSYLYAPHSRLWGWSAEAFSNPPMAHEHMLFPGLFIIILTFAGLLLVPMKKAARLHIAACGALMALTLSVRGLSLYGIISWLPGISAIRAVSRIQLINMWPIALYIAFVADHFIKSEAFSPLKKRIIIGIVALFTVVEASAVSHLTLPIRAAQERRKAVEATASSTIASDRIFFLAAHEGEPFFNTEIDGMIYAQDKGLATLNGYSGNFPPGFRPADACDSLSSRIIGYLQWSGIASLSEYLALIRRAAPVGFKDCRSAEDLERALTLNIGELEPVSPKSLKSSLILGPGWHRIEAEHVWSRKESVVNVPIPEACLSGDCALKLFFNAFGASPARPVHVHFFVGEHKDKPSMSAGLESEEPVRIDLPFSSEDIGRDSLLKVRVEIPEATSPFSLGRSSDRRELGIALRQFGIASKAQRISATSFRFELPPINFEQ